MGKHTNSGMGGFMSGASIRFSKYKGGGGVDAWRDALQQATVARPTATNRPRSVGVDVPKENTIHQGTVMRMETFGAFVQLGNGDQYKDGLLHVSCIVPSKERFASPEEAGLDVDMQVWVKVSDVRADEGKYGLDMRYVSQKDGKDLDPYNTKGRFKDNFFVGKNKSSSSSGGLPAPPAPLAPESAVAAAAPQLAEPRAAKPSKRKRDASSNSSVSAGPCDTASLAKEREKTNKKLEKARKKLEKARKKAEKAKKKNAKKEKKRKKKGDKDSFDKGSGASSDSS